MPDAAIDADLDRAAESARRHIGAPHRAAALGLQLNRITATTPLVYTRYSPMFSFVLAGRKRSIVGDQDQRWGRGNFLITPVDLPVVAGVVETGPRGDFISANWRLDPLVIAEVALSLPRLPSAPVHGRLGRVTPELADAVKRLFHLLDAPEEAAVLEPLLRRELVMRLLQTDQASRLLAAADRARTDVLNAAVEALTAGMSDPWTTGRLAARVGTSQATLTRRFRHLTGMAPMQYLKKLRLGEARRRMVVVGDSASQAAAAVGYVSASHFSRDYRAAYEVTPAADAARWRFQLVQAAV